MTIPTFTRSRSDGYELRYDAYTGFIQLSQALILSPEDTRALADDIRKLLLEIEKQEPQG